MCEPATIAAVAAWFGGTGTAAAGTAAAASTAGAAAAGAGTAAAAGGLTAMQTASLVATVAGTAVSAYGAYHQSKTAKKIAGANAEAADEAAKATLRRGEKDAMELQRRASQIKGQQRSMMAARGLDLTEGTAAQLQDEVDFFGATDAAQIRTNARRDAYGYRTQGANFRAEAGGYSPGLLASASLLNSGGMVADRWLRYSGGN